LGARPITPVCGELGRAANVGIGSRSRKECYSATANPAPHSRDSLRVGECRYRGVAIFLLARRMAPSLSLLLHQRVLRIWVLVALLIVISELVGVLAVFFRSSTLTDVAEDLLEFIVLSSVALGLHLLDRVEKEEISSLRYLAEVYELTGLNSRSFLQGRGTPARAVRSKRFASRLHRVRHRQRQGLQRSLRPRSWG
jgi:hypothetical protein